LSKGAIKLRVAAIGGVWRVGTRVYAVNKARNIANELNNAENEVKYVE
jgi:hypothetical protein